MLKIYADSSCSIKKEELENYDITLIPLKIAFGSDEYFDGDISFDDFYNLLENTKNFPKTSLPALAKVEREINTLTHEGNEVIIVTLSSKISGTYNALKLLFNENEKVHIIDSGSAVGAMRFIIDEIIKNKDKPVDEILNIVEELKPRIKTMAVPETLTYLLKGGRLSKAEWLIGSILQIKPTIGFVDGKVRVISKNRGIKKAMREIVDVVSEKADLSYGLIAAYTKNKDNVKELIEMLPDEVKDSINVYDNLSTSIAAHWGPGAFGLIFVEKK